MRWLFVCLAAVCLCSSVQAHHPDRANHPVYPYFDLIPPLGKSFPIPYRRKFNRPRHTTGKIAYYIAPSSQEAMAWHSAAHRGLYDKKHCPRIVTHYFFPKPWEALKVGPRPAPEGVDTGYGPRPTTSTMGGGYGGGPEDIEVSDAMMEAEDTMSLDEAEAGIIGDRDLIE